MSIYGKCDATLHCFDFVSSACNHCFNISWKSWFINSWNLEILIQVKRCSLVNKRCNLVQINFIKLNDCFTLVVDGGINVASIKIFVISPWHIYRFDEWVPVLKHYFETVLLLFRKLQYMLLVTFYVFV